MSNTLGCAEATCLWLARSYSDCYATLQKLDAESKADPKLTHNLCVVEHVLQSGSDPNRILSQLESIAKERLAAEDGSGGAGGESGTAAARPRSSGAVEVPPLVPVYDDIALVQLNMATLLYRQQRLASAAALLAPLQAVAEALPEGTAARVLALAVDTALEGRRLPAAVGALAQLERLHAQLAGAYLEPHQPQPQGAGGQGGEGGAAAGAGGGGGVGMQQHGAGAAGAAGGRGEERREGQAHGQQAAGAPGAVLALPRVSAWGSGPAASSRALLERQGQAPPVPDLKLLIRLYRSRLHALAHNTRAAKRELKALLAANEAAGSGGLGGGGGAAPLLAVVRAQLELYRGRVRKATKLLLGLMQDPALPPSLRPLLLNNLALVHHQQGKHTLALLYLTQALAARQQGQHEAQAAGQGQEKGACAAACAAPAPAAAVQYNAGLQHLMLRNWAAARQCLRAAAGHYYNTPLLWLRTAEAALGLYRQRQQQHQQAQQPFPHPQPLLSAGAAGPGPGPATPGASSTTSAGLAGGHSSSPPLPLIEAVIPGSADRWPAPAPRPGSNTVGAAGPKGAASAVSKSLSERRLGPGSGPDVGLDEGGEEEEEGQPRRLVLTTGRPPSPATLGPDAVALLQEARVALATALAQLDAAEEAEAHEAWRRSSSRLEGSPTHGSPGLGAPRAAAGVEGEAAGQLGAGAAGGVQAEVAAQLSALSLSQQGQGQGGGGAGEEGVRWPGQLANGAAAEAHVVHGTDASAALAGELLAVRRAVLANTAYASLQAEDWCAALQAAQALLALSSPAPSPSPSSAPSAAAEAPGSGSAAAPQHGSHADAPGAPPSQQSHAGAAGQSYGSGGGGCMEYGFLATCYVAEALVQLDRPAEAVDVLSYWLMRAQEAEAAAAAAAAQPTDRSCGSARSDAGGEAEPDDECAAAAAAAANPTAACSHRCDSAEHPWQPCPASCPACPEEYTLGNAADLAALTGPAALAATAANLGAVFAGQGEVAQGAALARQALALQPGCRTAVLLLVYCELAAGNAAGALALLRQAQPLPL